MDKKPTYQELEQRVKELERGLRDHYRLEAEIETIVRLSPDMIGSGNLDGYFTKINSSFEKILGYPEEEFCSRPFLAFVHDDDLKNTQEALISAAKGKRDISIENRYRCKNGDYKWIDWKVVALADKYAFYTIGRDITHRKMAEEALRESEEKYRCLMQDLAEGVVIAEGLEIKFVNRAILDMFGFQNEDEVVGLNFTDLASPKFRDFLAQRGFERDKGEEVPTKYESKAMRKDGTEFDCEVSVSRVHYKGRIARQGILRDITEKKRFESQLRHSQKMEAIGTLTGGIAHDFNNILYMISGNAELALTNIAEWDPVHGNLEEIKAASLKGAAIVKQLLNFSRRSDQDLRPIVAIPAIKDSLKFLRSTIPATIEIRTNIKAKEHTILADPIQINQVMMNLCINASQEMTPSGGILEVSIENITLDKTAADEYADLDKGDYIKISVSDTGPGINPDFSTIFLILILQPSRLEKAPAWGWPLFMVLLRVIKAQLPSKADLDKAPYLRFFFL